MTVDTTLLSDWRDMQRKNAATDATETALKSGGGDGTYDGMEARVAKLENGVVDIKKSLADIRETLASIDERTKHMATKWEVVIILGVMTGVIGGVVALTARFLP